MSDFQRSGITFTDTSRTNLWKESAVSFRDKARCFRQAHVDSDLSFPEDSDIVAFPKECRESRKTAGKHRMPKCMVVHDEALRDMQECSSLTRLKNPCLTSTARCCPWIYKTKNISFRIDNPRSITSLQHCLTSTTPQKFCLSRHFS